MIVDDHPAMRLGITAIICRTSDMVVVGEARSGEEAFEQFADLRPDVTIMDMRLPGMDGADAIRLLRSRYPDSRFLVITAHRNDEAIHRALEAGAGSYLLKGMTYETLLDAVRRVNAGEHFLPLPVDRDRCATRTTFKFQPQSAPENLRSEC
jgi:DNA-binding NarL/FixJ family response regulator